MTQSSKQPTLSIILPTMNEEQHIGSFCTDILTAFQKICNSVEIVIVDASSDATWSILGKLAHVHSEIRPLQQKSSGFSSAIGEGLEASEGEWLLSMNADGNHRIEDAVALFQARAPKKITIGSRFVSGGGTKTSYLRFLMSRYTSRFIGILSGSKLRENFSSFFVLESKLLNHDVISSCFRGGGGEGMLYLVSHLRRNGIDSKEYPVIYGARKSGSSKTNLLDFLYKYLVSAYKIRRDRPRPAIGLLGRLAQVLPVLLFLWICVRHPEVFNSATIEYFPLLLVFSCLIGSVLMRVCRFSAIIKRMGWNPGFSKIALDLIGSRYWNEILPIRLGDFIRLKRLNQRDRIPAYQSLGMIYWEKIVGISTGLFGLIAALLYMKLELAAGFISLKIFLFISTPILASWLFWILLKKLFRMIFNTTSRQIDLQRIQRELKEVKAEVTGPGWFLRLPLAPVANWITCLQSNFEPWRVLLKPLPLLHTIFTSFAIWAFVAGSLIFLNFTFGLSISIPVLIASAFATCMTAQLRFLPGGIGQVEVTQAAVLCYFGVPLEHAILLASAYIITMRLTNVILGLCRFAVFKLGDSEKY